MSIKNDETGQEGTADSVTFRSPLHIRHPPSSDRAVNSREHNNPTARSTTSKSRSKMSTWLSPSCADTCGYKVRSILFLLRTTTNTVPGLTDDHPTLTTFFEGEIIGPKHLFRTTHTSWNSSEKIDLQHWARFPPFRPLAKTAKANSSFTLKNNLDREHLFMRWKEYFLVPDHRVKSISGASFEGFYYICFDQRKGGVSGIYFHAKSEKYQQLELMHVPDMGCMGAVEFR